MKHLIGTLGIFLWMIGVSTATGFAQTPYRVGGIIKDTKGNRLPIASVQIQEIKKGTTTDSEGRFELWIAQKGTYTIVIQYLGFKTLHKTITIPSSDQLLIFILEEDQAQLSEIQIVGETETRQVALQPIKVEVINTKAVQEQPSTLVELMNRSAGIRIRQTGGLGSSAGLMINGFQDRAIKNFKDGIPLDYLGAGYTISLVPVNMLERVEIYKGVLPTSLGADALGGAVNMITKKSLYRYIEASYEVASFNTHRISLNALYRDTTHHFFLGADAFVNRSDNNYKVDVTVTDQETTAQSQARVSLFHNRFTNYYTELYGGISHTRWADELRIGLTYFFIDRQNQYGSSMSQPFGASLSKQYSLIPTLRYHKTFGKISLDQFFTYSNIYSEQTDTTKGTYDWYGNFISSPSRQGEATTRGSLSDITFSYRTSRTHLSYVLGSTHTLEVNLVSTQIKRTGKDPRGLTLPETGQDILSLPATYSKFIAAVGLHSTFLHQKITNNLIGKFYYYNTSTIDVDKYGTTIGEHRYIASSHLGLAEAVKFSIDDLSFIRVSAEAATRLPEQDEMFGDGNFHRSNFLLLPEKSINFNAGFRTEKQGIFSLEVNSFYRITKDLILKVPIDFLFTQNQNVSNVKGLGLETDLRLFVTKAISINGNFTYQNFRLFDTDNRLTEGARLRNTPYFFANLGLTSVLNHIAGKNKLDVLYYFTFVREYYLDYVPKNLEPDGFLGLWGKAQFDAPNIIPNQYLHTTGITFHPASEQFSVSFQVKNLWNAKVYDNFRIQNAGRSFHLKLNYILK